MLTQRTRDQGFGRALQRLLAPCDGVHRWGATKETQYVTILITGAPQKGPQFLKAPMRGSLFRRPLFGRAVGGNQVRYALGQHAPTKPRLRRGRPLSKTHQGLLGAGSLFWPS